jgi:hypothetical protein
MLQESSSFRRRCVAAVEYFTLLRMHLSWRNIVSAGSALLDRRPPAQKALQAVRVLVFDHEEYPGFGGTCFLVSAFGTTYAITARHCLGTAVPDHIRVPATRTDGKMLLLPPDNIYWYNAGDFDDSADVAVIVLSQHLADSLFIGSCGFSNPTLGETLHIPGYPKSRSRVHYDLKIDGEPVIAPDGEHIRHLFLWQDVTRKGQCIRPPGPTVLGSVKFSQDDAETSNGMSGAPVFVERQGKLAIAGMLVRANGERGHFIGGEHLARTLMRVVAKDTRAVNVVERLVYASALDGDHREATLGHEVTTHIGCVLRAMFEGAPEGEVRAILDRWLAGEGALGQLAIDRALELRDKGALTGSLKGVCEVLQHIRNNPPAQVGLKGKSAPAA